MTGFSCALYTSAEDSENGSLAAAAAGRLGNRYYSAAAAWTRSSGGIDTLHASLGTALTLRGDPVGFMEGVFGPSITLGGGLGYVFSEGDPDGDVRMLSANLGLQFSVFPTVAVGVDMSGIRLAGDRIGERRIDYGFTTIFDRRFRGHFSVTDGRPAVGFELGVRDWLTVRSGSDGSSWSSGVSLASGRFGLDWSVVIDELDTVSYLGVSYHGEDEF
ncbi:MAG: hypothetical protein AVO35_10225 [Candidatus Aegiribacteria sp. MLS_C]|nr:MAG: hypothetical protein AVO35_10225 [Candidatus Aegiribacteria sp. MLS_C]